MQEEINSYIDKMKNIQKDVLNFIDDDTCIEENFNNLTQSLSNMDISKDKYHLRSFLYLISIISNNHLRSKSFFSKIEKILKILKKQMCLHFKEAEIFDIFQKNKRILLFLIQAKMITINQFFATKIMNEGKNSCLYFYDEIKNYVKIDNYDNDPNIKSNDYLAKRSKGLNDDEICQLIQNDSLDEFISYIENADTSYDTTINQSIYETNPFLIDKTPTLIEYATFYGSIQIIHHLLENKVKITPNLWLYAIHSNNMEVIKLLEEYKIDVNTELTKQLLKVSIKCHHIDITNYLLSKFFNNDEYYQFNTIQQNFVDYSFQYYNYMFFPVEIDINSIVFTLIKYDHFDIFEIICKNKLIDISKAIDTAEKEDKIEFIQFLSSYSLETSDMKPFPVWKRIQSGQLKLTNFAANLFANSNSPCFVLLFGSTRSGKSTIASVLFGGKNVDVLNSKNLIFEVSYTLESCTKGINAVGPIKCKDFVSTFDLDLDDMNNENLNRDIFLIDTEGLSSVDGEVEWLKQAICSMIPFINVSFYVGQSINKDDVDRFIKYASLIQTFERMNIFHGYGYINNGQKMYGANIYIQNEDLTNRLMPSLSSNFDDINNSHYKFFYLLNFGQYENEFYSSLTEVARFIVDICLHDGSKINGNLLVKMVESYANEIDNIDSNLNNQIIIDKMKKIFFESLKKEILEQILKQEEYIQNFVSERLCAIGLFKFDDIKLDDKDRIIIDDIVNDVIQKTYPNLSDQSIKESAIKFAIDIFKKSYEKEIDKYKNDHKKIYKIFDKINDYDKLKDDHDKLKENYYKLKKDHEELKEEHEELKGIVNIMLNDKNKKHKKNIPFDENKSNQYNGIFTELGKGEAINALKNKIIEIKCSSFNDSNENSCQPENILIFQDDQKYFQSKDEPNSWIAINFKAYIVRITHYTIKWNGNLEENNIYPLNFKIEGSNDFKNWETLDTRNIEGDLDSDESNTFEVVNTPNMHKYYQFIRIVQNGTNSINNNCLILTSLELFGTMRY